MAHADIAPQRKDDPGRYSPGNNWRSRGLVPGRMPAGELLPCRARAAHTGRYRVLLELLARYGYDVKPDMTPRDSGA